MSPVSRRNQNKLNGAECGKTKQRSTVKRIVAKATLDENKIESVLKAWSKLHRTYIRQLYESIPRRIRSVIAQKGSITNY